jgi:hypothetical protein
MTERKPPGEAWESFTERRIREAQAEGAFENLPGFGRPIPGIDEPLDENWWIREKLRREQINAVPPIIAARLEVEKTLVAIRQLSSEHLVRRRLEQLNESIRRAHFSHIAGPADGISPLDIESEVTRWRAERQQPPSG